MEEDKICAPEARLKVLKQHDLIVDPNGVLSWGINRSSGVMSTRALIFRSDRSHIFSDQPSMVTDVQPHVCCSLLWANCNNDARSGVVLAVIDLDAIGGEGRRLVVAVPPYKKRINFKTDAEALTHLHLKDVATLEAKIPPRGLVDLDGFIKSVVASTLSTHYTCIHFHLHLSAWCSSSCSRRWVLPTRQILATGTCKAGRAGTVC